MDPMEIILAHDGIFIMADHMLCIDIFQISHISSSNPTNLGEMMLILFTYLDLPVVVYPRLSVEFMGAKKTPSLRLQFLTPSWRWVFPKIGVPQYGWFIMEKPMNKWMIWGENPLFSETPRCFLNSNAQMPGPIFDVRKHYTQTHITTSKTSKDRDIRWIPRNPSHLDLPANLFLFWVCFNSIAQMSHEKKYGYWDTFLYTGYFVGILIMVYQIIPWIVFHPLLYPHITG